VNRRGRHSNILHQRDQFPALRSSPAGSLVLHRMHAELAARLGPCSAHKPATRDRLPTMTTGESRLASTPRRVPPTGGAIFFVDGGRRWLLPSMSVMRRKCASSVWEGKRHLLPGCTPVDSPLFPPAIPQRSMKGLILCLGFCCFRGRALASAESDLIRTGDGGKHASAPRWSRRCGNSAREKINDPARRGRPDPRCHLLATRQPSGRAPLVLLLAGADGERGSTRAGGARPLFRGDGSPRSVLERGVGFHVHGDARGAGAAEVKRPARPMAPRRLALARGARAISGKRSSSSRAAP